MSRFEIFFVLCLFMCTGLFGYFVGHAVSSVKCEMQRTPVKTPDLRRAV